MSDIVVLNVETVMIEFRALRKQIADVEAKLATLERPDEMIGQEEAMRLMKINAKSAFYAWIHEGWIINYGEGRKPLYSKRECETARFRKKQQLIKN